MSCAACAATSESGSLPREWTPNGGASTAASGSIESVATTPSSTSDAWRGTGVCDDNIVTAMADVVDADVPHYGRTMPHISLSRSGDAPKNHSNKLLSDHTHTRAMFDVPVELIGRITRHT